MPTTAPYSATTFSDVSRGSATLSWSDPQNAAIGTPTATDGGVLPGLLTHFLQGSGFAPVTPIPAGSTITGLTLYVRHRLTSSGGYPTAASLSSVQIGPFSAAPGRPVPSSFEDWAVPATTLPTLAQVNAGLNAAVAYDAATPSPDMDPAHYAVTVSPSGTQSYEAQGGLSKTQGFAVSVVYTGTGTPAPYVEVSLTGAAAATGRIATAGS